MKVVSSKIVPSRIRKKEFSLGLLFEIVAYCVCESCHELPYQIERPVRKMTVTLEWMCNSPLSGGLSLTPTKYPRVRRLSSHVLLKFTAPSMLIFSCQLDGVSLGPRSTQKQKPSASFVYRAPEHAGCFWRAGKGGGSGPAWGGPQALPKLT